MKSKAVLRLAGAVVRLLVLLGAFSSLVHAVPPVSWEGSISGWVQAGTGICPKPTAQAAFECACGRPVCPGLFIPDYGRRIFTPDPNGTAKLCQYPDGSCDLFAFASPVCPAGTRPTQPPGASNEAENFICLPVGEPLEVRATSLGAPRDSCPVANPVNPATGNKFQVEVDYRSEGLFPLVFARTYNSDEVAGGSALGLRWQHNYDRRLLPVNTTRPLRVDEPVLWLRRGDGKVYQYTLTADGVRYASASNSSEPLRRLDPASEGAGWELLSADDEIRERYASNGLLVAMINRAGLTIGFEYDRFFRLTRVIGPTGATLALAYDLQGRLASLTDPAGNTFLYTVSESRLASVRFPDGGQRIYHYEDARFPAALTGITDENGSRYATWAYDDQQRATLSEHAGVDRYRFAYATDGSVAITDPLGTTRTYRYRMENNVRDLIGIEGAANPPCGNAPRTDYAGLYVSMRTNWNGVATTYQRADPTRPDLETQRTEAAGTNAQRTVSTQWHPTFRLPIAIAEPYRRTTFEYDAQGNMLTRAVAINDTAAPRTWRWEYSTLGQPLRADGPRSDVSDVTTYSWYPMDAACPGASANGCRGRLESIMEPLGLVTRFAEYDAHGQPLRITMPNGLPVALGYDARRRLVSRTEGSESTRFTYDRVGQLTAVTLPDGSAVTYTYDQAQRLVGVTDNLGNRIVYSLDAMGNRVREEVTAAGGARVQTRTRIYSPLNRLEREVGAQGQTTTFVHDGEGNVTRITDPLRRITRRSYDPLNRLINEIDAAGGRTRFRFDLLDRLVSVSDPRDVLTQYRYDGYGNRLTDTTPDGGVTRRAFDIAGNVVNVKDGKGQDARRAYDALNRVTRVVYLAATGGQLRRVDYAYDSCDNGAGRLCRIDETAASNERLGSTQFAYDLNGRVTVQTRRIAGRDYTTRYAYDASGRLAAVTYPMGRVVAHGFDAMGRIARIETTAGGQQQVVVDGVAYQPFGPLLGFTFGNQQPYARTFDLDGRIASFTQGNVVKSVVFDAASQVRQVNDSREATRNAAYDYDLLGRLSQAVVQGTAYAYTYDAGGNRTQRTAGTAATSYSYETTSNRLAQIAGLTTDALAHDANGSIVDRGGLLFGYDARNRLVSSTTSIGLTSYTVNALGERVRKTSSLGDTIFHYDLGGRLIAESTPAGAPLREYLWLDDQPVAISTYANGTAALHYVFADHLGTPRAITDASQRLVWRWENTEPFGDSQPEENPSGLGELAFPLRFPGQYADRETNTRYNYFRDYDPATGRYVQSDPIGLAGGLNLFAYARSAPLRYRDRWGLEVEPADLADFANAAVFGTLVHSQLAQWARSRGLEGNVSFGVFGGRPDLIDPINKQLFELKPRSYYCDSRKYESAQQQLKEYLRKRKQGPWRRGYWDSIFDDPLLRFHITYLGLLYEVNVYPDPIGGKGSGLIFYDAEPIRNELGDLLHRSAPRPFPWLAPNGKGPLDAQ